MTGYYKLEGQTPLPVDNVREWGRWFESADRTVAATKVGDVRISTIFLGLDHSFGGPVPILFETLVFEGPLDGEMERYATWEEAEAGHAEMVKRVEAA